MPLFAYVEWYWKVWLKPWCLRILAVVLAILSVLLIWSEVTFFIVEPRLSLFAIFLYEAQKGYFYFYVEVYSYSICWTRLIYTFSFKSGNRLNLPRCLS